MTFDDYVSAVINQIKYWKKDHFMIVAHSIGVCVGLKIANHFKNKLKGFDAVTITLMKNKLLILNGIVQIKFDVNWESSF